MTAEEHQLYGGLGSAVAQVVAAKMPVPMEMVAMMDQYGKSGKPELLLNRFHLRASDIAEKSNRS